MVLEMIRQANDIKKLNDEQLKLLAEEIRQFLIEKISRTGGHLASNLGVVELTMALHLTLDFPEDKLIWDVGHQSYTHKLLTGRRDGFDQATVTPLIPGTAPRLFPQASATWRPVNSKERITM